MKQQEMVYALAKQVPDMTRGFSIATNYGEIQVPEGWMADRIKEHVERTLQCELLYQTRTELHGGAKNGN